MEHFAGVNAQERHDNEMLHLARKQVEQLEQIAQLLQQQAQPKQTTRGKS